MGKEWDKWLKDRELGKREMVIWVITTIRVKKDAKDEDDVIWRSTRSIGFTSTYELAEEMVLENANDMYECGYYRYVVIEETWEGAHRYRPDKEVWFEWIGDVETGGYRKVLKPEIFKRVCGFGLG